jgi:hypothetical protein
MRQKRRKPPWWFKPIVMLGSLTAGAVAAMMIAATAH